MSSWYNLNETPVTRYFNEFTNWITNILIKIEFGFFFLSLLFLLLFKLYFCIRLFIITLYSYLYLSILKLRID